MFKILCSSFHGLPAVTSRIAQKPLTYRRDNSWAIWAHQSGFALRFEHVCDSHHVVLRNALGNTDYEPNLGLDSLFYARCSDGRRYKYSARIGSSLFHSVCHAGEDRLAKMCFARLLGIRAADDVGSVLDCLLCVEGSCIWLAIAIYIEISVCY